MTEIQRKLREFILGYLDIGYWDLFGTCLPVARGFGNWDFHDSGINIKSDE
jgi:hypothetical protein